MRMGLGGFGDRQANRERLLREHFAKRKAQRAKAWQSRLSLRAQRKFAANEREKREDQKWLEVWARLKSEEHPSMTPEQARWIEMVSIHKMLGGPDPGTGCGLSAIMTT